MTTLTEGHRTLGSEAQSMLNEIVQKKREGKFGESERNWQIGVIKKLDEIAMYAPHEIRELLKACE